MLIPFLNRQSAAPSEPKSKPKPLTISAARNLYAMPESFVSLLPYYEIDEQSNVVLLDDGRSVAVVLDVIPVPTEGRSLEWKQNARDLVQGVLQDSLEEDPAANWILQTYAKSVPDLSSQVERLKEYVRPHAAGTEFSNFFIETMARHWDGMCRSEEGIFYDSQVTESNFRGSEQVVRFVLYRRLPANYRSFRDMTPTEETLDMMEKVRQSLNDAGIRSRQLTGREIFCWLRDFFNPAPSCVDGDQRRLNEVMDYVPGDELPFGNDLAESLFLERPESIEDIGAWKLGQAYVKNLRVDSVRAAPAIGQLTGEVPISNDGRASCLTDKLPPGCTLTTTVQIVPQNEIEEQIAHLATRSTGDGAEAAITRRSCEVASNLMAHKHKLLRCGVSVYITASSPRELRQKTNKVQNVLLNNHMRPINEDQEPLALNSFIWNAPMVWAPTMDRKYRAMRLMWAQHIAGLLPVYGRARGSSNPGWIFSNRGGQPILVDMMSREDRTQNMFCVLAGPPGTGKSVTMATTFMSMIAMHRPRTFLIEKGASFVLMAKFFEEKGLVVNRMQLKPGSGVSLAPFADAIKIIDREELTNDSDVSNLVVDEDDIRPYLADAMAVLGVKGSFSELVEQEQNRVWSRARALAVSAMLESREGGDDESRDILTDLAGIAEMMVTGCDAKEMDRMTRAEKNYVRTAIKIAAQTAKAANVTCRTQHVVDALKKMAIDDEYPEHERARIFSMSQSMSMFLDGLAGELFNSDGEAFPDADVTLIDFSTLGTEGHEASLNIAFASLMMHINALGEKHQFDDRKILVGVDEAHLFMDNEHLAPWLVRSLKVQRKLGIGSVFATQNLTDFHGPARKILSLAEWYLLLVPPAQEVEEFTKVRRITEDEQHLLLSCKKETGKYTEGVLFSGKHQFIFRNVPPSISLALSGTEKEEKAERVQYMREFGISEVQAAEYIAAQMDYSRGIADKPEPPRGRLEDQNQNNKKNIDSDSALSSVRVA